MCSIDLQNISEDRLASKQLLISLLNYMNSESFNPDMEVEISKIKELASQK
jgi:hypothetical protein